MNAAAFGESIDQRVLGGCVFIDAITGTSIGDPLKVSSANLQIRGNRSGVYVVWNAPGLSSLTTQFNPAASQWSAAQKFEVTVEDPGRRYLSRRTNIEIPQSLATLDPQPILLYASPSGELAPNWAVIRASVTDGAGAGLPWAVVQIIKSDDTVAATGVTDAHGEALLAVMGLGVQVSAASSGAVTEITIAVIVRAWFDPGVLTQPVGWVSNPDDILSNLSNPALKTASMSGALGAGQILVAAITIST